MVLCVHGRSPPCQAPCLVLLAVLPSASAPQLTPHIQGTGAVQKLIDFEVSPKENSSLAPCWPGFSLGAWKAPVQAERAKSMVEQV